MRSILMVHIAVAVIVAGSGIAITLPSNLKLVRQDGDYYTVRERATGLEQTYYVPGGVVGQGWTMEVDEDSVVFEQVGQINRLLIYRIKNSDFDQDGRGEMVGSYSSTSYWFLRIYEDSGNYDYTPVFTLGSPQINYDLGDIDRDGRIDILTNWDRSIFIYEQRQIGGYPDSNVWLAAPLSGNYHVWPRYSDLDGDGNFEISFAHRGAVHIYENCGDNVFEGKDSIRWVSPDGGPGDFASGDVDGDGLIEIIGGGAWGNLLVFENVADDSFELVWQGSMNNPNADIHGYLGDTDGNGYGEWVSGSHNFSRGGFFL